VGVLRQPVNLEVLDEPIALREELPYVGLLFVGLERCPVPIQLVKDPGLRIVVDRVSDV
jgi:hypothetical protein